MDCSEFVRRAALVGEVIDQTFRHSGFSTIHKIEALDRNTNGTGGFVLNMYGGVWLPFVELHFESVVGGSIDFEVHVYAEVEAPTYHGDGRTTWGQLTSRSIVETS